MEVAQMNLRLKRDHLGRRQRLQKSSTKILREWPHRCVMFSPHNSQSNRPLKLHKVVELVKNHHLIRQNQMTIQRTIVKMIQAWMIAVHLQQWWRTRHWTPILEQRHSHQHQAGWYQVSPIKSRFKRPHQTLNQGIEPTSRSLPTRVMMIVTVIPTRIVILAIARSHLPNRRTPLNSQDQRNSLKVKRNTSKNVIEKVFNDYFSIN